MVISVLGFVLGIVLMLVPAYIIQAYGLRLFGKTTAAFIGMLAKCAVVCGVMWLLSRWHSVAANVLASLLMAFVTAVVGVLKSRVAMRRCLVPALAGTFVAVVVVSLFFLLVVVQAESPFAVTMLLPVVGMLCGGMAAVCGKALSFYFMGLRNHGQMYIYLLGNGATRSEALFYFRKRALERVVVSGVRSMSCSVTATAPFVFWTAVMCGLDVAEAMMLQVVVVVSVVCASLVSVAVSLLVATHWSFDEYGRLAVPADGQQ